MKIFGKHVLIFAMAIMALSGCSSTPDENRSSAPPVGTPPAPIPYNNLPAPVTPKPAAKPVYKPLANDQCGANGLQYLVGKPRTEIPVPLDPGSRRVICSSCVTTQEYRGDRQTIVFDTDTGVIKSVTCG